VIFDQFLLVWLRDVPGTRVLPLCHNLVMNLIWAPDEDRTGDWGDWSLPRRWPTDARKFMFWIFAISPLLLWRTFCICGRFTDFTCVQMAATSVLAASSIWKGIPWARGWAIAASLMFFLMHFRQFLIPVRPTWDHHLLPLFVGMIGLTSFAWPADKLVAPSGSPLAPD
jgi:hypothetical protein